MGCSFLKKGRVQGLFSKGEADKCVALGTNIPEMRVTKFCEGDFFECELFRQEMKKKEDRG